jgi:hypothetical protein
MCMFSWAHRRRYTHMPLAEIVGIRDETQHFGAETNRPLASYPMHDALAHRTWA